MMDVGVSRDTECQKRMQGAGFTTGGFVQETLGGLP